MKFEFLFIILISLTLMGCSSKPKLTGNKITEKAEVYLSEHTDYHEKESIFTYKETNFIINIYRGFNKDDDRVRYFYEYIKLEATLHNERLNIEYDGDVKQVKGIDISDSDKFIGEIDMELYSPSFITLYFLKNNEDWEQKLGKIKTSVKTNDLIISDNNV